MEGGTLLWNGYVQGIGGYPTQPHFWWNPTNHKEGNKDLLGRPSFKFLTVKIVQCASWV